MRWKVRTAFPGAAMNDAALLALILAVCALVVRWISADDTDPSEHDPNDWP